MNFKTIRAIFFQNFEKYSKSIFSLHQFGLKKKKKPKKKWTNFLINNIKYKYFIKLYNINIFIYAKNN